MKTNGAGLLVFALLAVGGSEAQGQVRLGPEVSLAQDVDFGIGAVVEMPMTSIHERLEFAGRFTLFFPDRGNYWELDGDVRYLFPLAGENTLLPYAMAGLAIGHSSWDYEGPGDGSTVSDTELALRIGGGAKFPMASFTPFVDLGLTIGDLPDFNLRAGVTFPLG